MNQDENLGRYINKRQILCSQYFGTKSCKLIIAIEALMHELL